MQLRKVGRVYGRPLAVLLLSERPNERGFDALRDFRRVSREPRLPTPELLSEFRRALGQREVLLELAEISPDSVPERQPLPSLDAEMSPDSAGDRLREFLGVDRSQQRRAMEPGAALMLWIAAVEARGILVVHTKGVDPAEMHGFSVSDWPFPIIALNGTDQPRRRLFTLLHELAHLSLNLGGICDLHEVLQERRALGVPNDLEAYCNAVAAAVLLPGADLLADSLVASVRAPSHDWTLDELRILSRRFGASSEAILLRLLDLGAASWATYRLRKPELDQAYEQAREEARRRNRESPGGPSYYVVKARDIGHAYASSVIDAYRSDRISPLDVADFLNIRFSQLDALEAAV